MSELHITDSRSLSQRVEDIEAELTPEFTKQLQDGLIRLSALERNAQAWGHEVPTLEPAPDPTMNCVSCGGPLHGKWVSDDRQCTTCVDAHIAPPATPVAPRPDFDPGKEPR